MRELNSSEDSSRRVGRDTNEQPKTRMQRRKEKREGKKGLVTPGAKRFAQNLTIQAIIELVSQLFQ